MKHVYEKVFTSDSGMRRNVPKVLVVVTDGRSQDDVKKSAEKLQHSGANGIINCFHVRFGLCCILYVAELFQIIFTFSVSAAALLNFNNPYSEEPACDYLKLNNGVWFFSPVCVFCHHRLQCVCGRSGRCGHNRVENYRQQAQ